MDVFDLSAKISLDSSQYEQGLNDAEGKGSSFAQRIKGGLGTAAKVGTAAIGAIGTATTVLSGVFVKGTSSVAQYGDNIDKMSQKMGMSSDAYQEWDAVMRHSGTSMETMKASMKTLANAAENGSEAFQQLGISQEEIANMSQEQLFEKTISALQNVENETERTYLAGKTLGRGATELGALLNTSAEDTQAMRDRVRELGGVMSGDAVKAAAKYQDQLQDMQTAFQGVKRGLISDFLPGMTTVMSGLTEIFSGNSEGGVGMITEGVDSIISGLQEALPRMMEIGGQILSSIGQAIMENLPSIMETGTQIIANLITSLVTNLPNIISTVLQMAQTIIVTLVSNLPTIVGALIEAIPTIIQTIVSMDWAGFASQIIQAFVSGFSSVASSLGITGDMTIAQILGKITSGLGRFLSKGIEIVGKLAQGILNAAPQAINSFFSIITQIIQYIMQNLPQFLSKGMEMLGRLAQGIINGLPQALSAIGTGLGRLIVTIAQNLPQFLSKGIELMGKIAAGIIRAIPQILSALAGGVRSMMGEFSKVNWGQVGISIMTGIANGIRSGLSAALNAMAGAVKNILSKAKSALGIKSPSKVFREQVGKMISMGMALGIKDKMPAVVSALDDINDELIGGFDTNIGGDFGADELVAKVHADDGISGAAKQVYNNWQITVDGAQSPELWAERFTRELELRTRMA